MARLAGRPAAVRSTLLEELAAALPERPFTVRLWDGAALPSTTGAGPVFTVRRPEAVGHLLRAPGELGLGRAYVSGALGVDDLDAVMRLLGAWSPPPVAPLRRARLALAAARLAGPRPVRVPASELRPRGRRHSVRRDARAVRHHYDLPPAFFALFLDASMTYSCGVFSRGARTLEEAQTAKLEVVCQKLRLRPGERVLDVGCGWGSFAVHAAAQHGARVVAVTLSAPQAARARQAAREAGVADLVDVRVMDYREVDDGPFDAVASLGMVEHVGEDRIDEYARRLAALVAPGGRLLNHGIARVRHTDYRPGPFSDRYVFPDADPLPLSRVLRALELAGFATEHVEGFAGDYEQTLTHWIARLDDRLDEAVALAGDERVRVWRLYLRAARNGFRTGFTSIYQVRGVRA